MGAVSFTITATDNAQAELVAKRVSDASILGLTGLDTESQYVRFTATSADIAQIQKIKEEFSGARISLAQVM